MLHRSRAAEKKRSSSMDDMSCNAANRLGGIAMIVHVHTNALQYKSMTKRGVVLDQLQRDAIHACVHDALKQLKAQNTDVLLSKEEAQVIRHDSIVI